MRRPIHPPYVRLSIALIVTVASWFVADNAGRALVVDRSQHADLIVVLAGDLEDVRSRYAFALLRAGYAPELVLDAPDWIEYGRRLPDVAESYLAQALPDQAGRFHVCRFLKNSTQQELLEVRDCIDRAVPNARSAMIVTSSFHTRRALSVAQRVMPQYRWCVASVPDSRFDAHWWRKREWAKTMIMEWQKLLWWTTVERWSVPPSAGQENR